MDTFFVLFPKAVGAARPTNDQQSERPDYFFCTVEYLLHMICRYQQAGEWTRKQVEMGSCGILDMCSLQEYNRRRGGEGRDECFAGRTTSNEQLRRASKAGQQGERERDEGEFPIWVSLSFGREEQIRVTSGHPEPGRERYSTKMPVRSTHWSIHGRGRRPPPKWSLAPTGPPPSFPPTPNSLSRSKLSTACTALLRGQ